MAIEANKENSIEWYTGNKTVTLSLTSRKHMTKVKRAAEKHPEEVEVYENPDGSICAHVPLSYIKISPPRQVSEEQRLAAADRLRKSRAKNEDEELDKECVKEED